MEVHHHFEGEEGARRFGDLVTTRDAGTNKSITHLTIVINASTWTDYEDDCWASAIVAFQRYSQSLKHLKIAIKGNTLFTEKNIVKPVLHTTIPTKFEQVKAEGDSAETTVLGGEASPRVEGFVCDDQSIVDTTPQARKSARMSNRNQSTKVVCPASPMRLSDVKPASADRNLKYTYKRVPLTAARAHVYDKAIIPALLGLRSPIAMVTLEGPWEIDLRLRILNALSSNWPSDTYGRAQAGYDNNLVCTVTETWERERAMMKCPDALEPVGGDNKKQDEEDFGFALSSSRLRKPRSYASLPRNWIVPTGKAGRVMLGWSGKKAWRGPTPPPASPRS